MIHDDDAPLSHHDEPIQDSPIKDDGKPCNIDFIIQSSMQMEDRMKPSVDQNQHDPQLIMVNETSLEN